MDTGFHRGHTGIVETEAGARAALLVDAINGQRQVVIKSLETNYRHVDGVSAATILGEIWINGSAAAAKSVAVDPGLGPTEFTLTFDTPLVVPAWTMFYATTYDGGTRYAQTGRLPWDTTFATGLTVPVGSTVLLLHPGGYKGGTGQPVSFSDSNSYPVEVVT